MAETPAPPTAVTSMAATPMPGPPCEDLRGKIALVTGAGSRGDGEGIGRAAALLLARQGARVGLLDRHLDRIEATAARILDNGGDAVSVATDVADAGSCERAVDTVRAKFGGIDILVNNVGVSGPAGNVTDVSLEDWDMAMRTNLSSMVFMSRFVIPLMRTSGGGSIVNVSSTAGLIAAQSERLFYPTSKGAIIALTRSMARQHGSDGIRVNCVIPGMVATPKSTEGVSSEVLLQRAKMSFLPSEGTAWDVANAVLYFASDMARWVTGTTLIVDGGLIAGGGV
jgi:NAD(P)-dependent dehydrogenase (short-subunit alcohol dehydrogenase family)